ncbi:MAG TPA: ImmA/IrrE family metallo-endopeptidase [Actinomycetes bacterium]|nr:ImmA/IrrE family metallo-endopeptidase [Actinomycetes bacterium]
MRRFLDQHQWRGTPEELVCRLCAQLLEEAGVSVPVDVRMLASFRGIAAIFEVDQAEAGCIFCDGERLLIHLRGSDSPERRRFTICHEILHTFFPGFREERRKRIDRTVGAFDPDQFEEYLCDLGAAELLLPRQPFLGALPPQPCLDDVIELAAVFDASLEATAIRVVNLTAAPMALVVLEPAWKPLEQRELARRATQPALAGLEGELPPKRLRVRWAYGPKMTTIPKHKSIDDTAPLAAVLETGGVDYLGVTGLTGDPYQVSARHLPYHREGEPVDRVLVLLQDPMGLPSDTSTST